ncbi:MAG: Asp-tRNA(Asn)/Glu-tRNA(Gln) amidotransferase subunit GatA, partial [Bacilli bacterium]|nr:Asp-tRNA(Asn)/Glu-tRNA(Gln) amidotransferase subunit GatA [Bacilli bacterium]
MHKKTIIELHNDLVNHKIKINELALSASNHLQAINNKLNAINSYCDYPVNDNDDYSSLLGGIPYVMKDLFATKDYLTTSSSAMLANFIPKYSATVYNNLVAQNTIMIAKSNLDEYGMGGTNLNSINGMSRNPYDCSKGSGGSSGGSAAVVAAGCVPFALGTDTGDSVRKPAAYCGIYGFKPSWTVVSRYGVFPYASSLEQPGVFTRCVDDVAIVMECLNGPDPLDMSSLVHQKEAFYQNLLTNDKPLKIGYIKELIETFDNEIVLNQFEEVKEYLQSLNHELVELHIPKPLLRCGRGVYHVIANSEATSNLANLTGIDFGLQIINGDVKNSIIASRNAGLTKYTKARLLIGALSLKEANKENYFEKAKKIRTIFINTFNDLYREVDVIFAPAANSRAIDFENEVFP